jgi:hypothetical protein
MAAQASALGSLGVVAHAEELVSIRYESLIRLADSIRAQHDPNGLFRILVRELSEVVPFDAVAQFDEAANKLNWHFSKSANIQAFLLQTFRRRRAPPGGYLSASARC